MKHITLKWQVSGAAPPKTTLCQCVTLTETLTLLSGPQGSNELKQLIRFQMCQRTSVFECELTLQSVLTRDAACTHRFLSHACAHTYLELNLIDGIFTCLQQNASQPQIT